VIARIILDFSAPDFLREMRRLGLTAEDFLRGERAA